MKTITHKPFCLLCGRKTARYLPGTSNPSDGAMIFCTLKCAAIYAVRQCALQRWCEIHKEWFHADDGCGQCYDDYFDNH
jgi:hypothetical protein